MKSISVITIFVLVMLFGSPLIKIRNDYKRMEYQEIGEEMIGNIDPFIKSLDIAAKAGENLSQVGEKMLTALDILIELTEKIEYWLNKGLSSVVDFVKGIFENDTGQKCTGDAENGFTCGSSEGGGGGSFGGGIR